MTIGIWGGLSIFGDLVLFPDLKLYEYSADALSLENLAGGTHKDLKMGVLDSHLHTVSGISAMRFYRSAGTEAAPTIVSSIQDIPLSFYFYNGTDYMRMGQIGFSPTGTIDGTRIPTVFSVWVGSTANPSILTQTFTVAFETARIYGDLVFAHDGASIYSNSTAGTYLSFITRKTDATAAWYEVGRLQVHATNPYFQIGRSDTGVATASVTDMFRLSAGVYTTVVSAGFGFGLPVFLSNASAEIEERARVDFELTTATNAAEDSRILFSTQNAGAAIIPLSVGNTGSSTKVTHGVSIKTVKYTFHHGSTLFDADGLTDSANVWNQPAGSVLLGVKMVLNEQFAGNDPAALTDLDVTIGLAGDQDGLLAGAMNGLSDAVGTAYKTRGEYWNTSAEGCFWYADAATQWVAYSTSVGCNVDHLSAGEIAVYFTYLDIP